MAKSPKQPLNTLSRNDAGQARQHAKRKSEGRTQFATTQLRQAQSTDTDEPRGPRGGGVWKPETAFLIVSRPRHHAAGAYDAKGVDCLFLVLYRVFLSKKFSGPDTR
jgi:hypothetical protein